MSSPLSIILFVILVLMFIVGVVALIVFFAKKQRKKLDNNFQKLAQEFRINYIEPERKWWKKTYPMADGMWQNRHIRIGMRIVSSGENQQEYTYISMVCTSENYTMALTPEGFFNKIGKVFGSQDIQIGDEAFDEAFMIKGNNERIIKNILDYSTKQMLVENKSKLTGKLEVRHNEIYYEGMQQMYSDSNYEVIRAIVNLMGKFAKRTDEVQHYI